MQRTAAADMLLTWHLVTQERTDVRTFNTASRYNCWSCGSSTNVSVRQYTQGTFIVDMVDPIALRSVWRSIFESRMRDQPDPERAAENRRAAAAAIFAEFPPHGAPKCAGLELHRYSVEELTQRLGPGFALVDHFDHTYINPAGDPRPYIYALFKRTA